MQKEILVQTGGLTKLKTGFATTMSIIYAGMPNDTSFAITFMYAGFASNIFYAKDSTFITVINQRLKVIEVTREYIILSHEKKIDILQQNPRIHHKKGGTS